MHVQHLKSGLADNLTNKKRVLTKAFINMSEELELSREELSQIIGPSTATLSRIFNFKKSNFYLNPESKEGELALLLLRLYRSLDVLFGGNAKQGSLWLRSHNKHLNGVPIDLMKSVEGLVMVIEYLDAMRGKN